MAEETSIMVHIPLNKIQWKPGTQEAINKIELTHIDHYLTSEQKKRRAQFFREEAAKRTKYDVEPTWTLPGSVQATNIPIEQTASEPKTSIYTVLNVEEYETNNIDIIEISTSPLSESGNESETSSENKTGNESETSSENKTGNESETGNENEPGIVEGVVSNLITTNQGSYVNLKRNLFTAKTFLKAFERLSKTQMKKQAYKEKTKHSKALKRQHRP
ncbi:hypothetical protein ACI65C_013253 [Semiaphis heraclei]